METNARHIQDAETIDQQLRLIRRALRQAYADDERRAGLTGPQTHAMAVLTQALREGQDGLTIRELSNRMGLAQSTVSSLVGRLEQKMLLRREVDPHDRRCTRIVLVEAVKTYLQRDQRLGPLAAVMQQASEEERKIVLDGLNTLYRLLTKSSELEMIRSEE